jgi:hypothetical protein
MKSYLDLEQYRDTILYVQNALSGLCSSLALIRNFSCTRYKKKSSFIAETVILASRTGLPSDGGGPCHSPMQ